MYNDVHSGSCAPAAPRCGPAATPRRKSPWGTISSQAL